MDEESLQASLAFFKDILSDLDWLLSEFNRNDGFLSFPSEFIDLLLKDGLPSWAFFYEDYNLMKTVSGVALLGEDRIKALSLEIKNLNAEQLLKKKDKIKYEILESIGSGQLEDFGEIEGLEGLEGNELANKLKTSEKHRKALVTNITRFLPHLFHYLALMTHGQTMCDLIEKAKKGNDDAFFDAIQIDRTLVYEIPYFKERIFRAQLSNDPKFLNDFSTHFKGKIFGHKFRYPQLWLLFALLEDENFLDIPLDKLLTVCEDVGVYGKEFGVNDTNTLSKRRIEYKKKKGTLIKI